MPQSNADPATPHPSYFTTGRHRPPHGLRVTGLNNPPKADKYRKIHTRSFSGYDQQLPNNLGMSVPQSNANPATPHPSYFTTGRHRPPHGLRVICLNNPPKPDKYRKIHTRSFSGYDQQLPNNLGEEERTRPQTATPPLGLQQNTSSRLKSPLNHAHSSCPNLSLFELACQTSPRPICASCANKRNLQHPLKRARFYRPKHCLQTPLTHTSNHKKRG